MKIIILTQGKFAVVDDKDFERISQHKWYAYKGHRTYYAVRDIWHNGKKSCLPMQNEMQEIRLPGCRWPRYRQSSVDRLIEYLGEQG